MKTMKCLFRRLGSPWDHKSTVLLDYCLMAMILVLPIAMSAQITMSGPETQVNTTTDNTQQNPAVSSDTAGNYLITWESFGTGNSGFNINGQRYDSGGATAGTQFNVNTTTNQDQRFPATAMDWNGNSVVMWMDAVKDGSGWGIYGQRYDDLGIPQGTEFLVNSTTAGHQKFPSVAMAKDGSFVAAWMEVALNGSSFQIKAQRFLPNGTMNGSQIAVDTVSATYKGYPAIAVSPDGSFVISWQQANVDASGLTVVARRFDVNGVILGLRIQVNTATTENQQAPGIAMDSTGNFSIVWSSYAQDDDGEGIYGQRYLANGTPDGSEFQISTTTTGAQTEPNASSTLEGILTVVWSSYGQDGSFTGTYLQSYASNSAALGTETLINTRTADFQQFPHVAHAKLSAEIVIVWQDGLRNSQATHDGDDYGIYSQRFFIGFNAPPNAICQDVTVSADGNCQATVDPVQVDNGSLDPEGNNVTLLLTPAGPYPLGQTQVQLIVGDGAGLFDTCNATITVNDNTPPTVNCPGDIVTTNDAGQCGAIVNFAASISDNCPGTTLVCMPVSGSLFPIGVTEVTCTATDASGNQSICMFNVTVNDTEAPTINCPTDIIVNNDAGQCGAVVNFAPTINDNCPGSSVVCTPVSGTLFPVGTTQVTCTVTDASGNQSVCSFNVTVNDTEVPTINCPSDFVTNNNPGQCGAVVNFTVGSSDNCPGSSVVCTPASGSLFPIGTTQVSCTVTDASGNQSACSFNVTVNDIESPTINCPSDIAVDNDAGQCGAVVNFSPTTGDNCPGESVACTPASGSLFPIGITLVTCTVTDASGNQSICSFNVTVNDIQSPTITCPADIAVNNDAGLCGAVVNFSPTTGDNCPGESVVCTPASGSIFPLGTTQVICSVTDVSGNQSVCSFNVTVNDTEPPVITCPTDIVRSNDIGQCGAVVSFAPDINDSCPGATVACLPASGSLFPIGTTQVICTVTDASGNQSVCSFNVTINDIQSPAVTCPADIVTGNDAGQCGAVVNFAPTTSDNCSGETVICIPASGSLFPIGNTFVVCIVTDASGNQNFCFFNVTVNDTESPTLSCPTDIVTNNDQGECGAVVNFAPTVSDNCPGVTTVCTPASGSLFAIGTTQVTCTATDESGNQSVCSFNVTVNDTESPTITCPSDIVMSNDQGQCGAVVNFTPTIGDNCPGALLVCSPASGSLFAIGTTQVTCTATDASGNQSVCSFNVIVNDIESPTVNCPSDIVTSNDAGQCGAVVNFSPATTDNCPGETLVCSPASGSFFPIGNTLVICIVTDASGNQNFCSFIVTVNDTETPTSSCPADIVTDNDAGQCSAIVNFSATASDNCPGAYVICTPPSGSVFAIGTTQVTCIATDASGNQNVCSFNVTVNDTESPTISCPADIVTNNDQGQCGAIVDFVSTASDNCPGASVVCTPASGSLFAIGTTQVTCTATDASGNQSVRSFNITVNDTELPTISCPADITVNNDAGQCGTIVNFTPTAIDNCPGATVVCTPASGSSFAIGTTQVICTVTDASGNQSICSFNVAVNDIELPTISCPADIVTNNDAGQCGAVVNFSSTASDNCPGVSVVCSPASGSLFAIGTTQVTCTATDPSGNQSVCTFNITVNDIESPTINCPADIIRSNDIGQCGAVVNFSPNTSDNCPGETVVCSPASGSLFSIGTTQVTCTVTDASGNQSVCFFNVTVNDIESPSITCPADIVVSNDVGQCGAVVNFSPVTSDNCPGVSVLCSSASGSLFPIGTTQVTCTVTDASGNKSECTFNVTVNDTELPTISCPADVVTNNDADQCGAVVIFTATASDNCPGVSVVCSPVSGSLFPIGTTQVTCTATDASGNLSVCIFDVTVIDTESPTVSCPADIIRSNDIGQCGAVVDFAPTVSGNCRGGSVVCSPASGSLFPIGTTQVTCTVTDDSGNQGVCTFNVTVNDIESPLITCPTDIAVNNDVGQCGAVVNFNPTVSDNCPGATVVCVPASGSLFPIGTTHVICTATDASGYESVCTFNVTVNDTESPTISCPADIVTVNDTSICGAVVNYDAIIATDNCPGVVYSQIEGLGSGSLFPVGVTTETYVALDSYGNSDTCSFTITVSKFGDQHLLYSYTVIGFDEVKMEGNTVESGGVGVVKSGKKVILKDLTMVVASNTFVRSPVLDLDNTSEVTTYYQSQFPESLLPTFISGGSCNNDVVIPDDSPDVILTESCYGKIDVGKNVKVTFSGHSTVEVEEMDMKDNSEIHFDQNTNLLIEKDFQGGKEMVLSNNGFDVWIYNGKKVRIEEDSEIEANIFSEDDLEVEVRSNMTGLFISKKKVFSKDSVTWNWNSDACPSDQMPDTYQGQLSDGQNNPLDLGLMQDFNIDEDDLDMVIFPNPTVTHAMLELSRTLGHDATVVLTDVSGRIVGKVIMKKGDKQTNLDLANLQPGMYNVSLIAKGALPIIKRIIVLDQN